MIKRSIAAAFAVALAVSSAAFAQTCSPTSLPYTLTNGATADAVQVMADVACPAYGLGLYSGNIGIGTMTPATTLDVNGPILDRGGILYFNDDDNSSYQQVYLTQYDNLFALAKSNNLSWAGTLMDIDMSGNMSISGALYQYSDSRLKTNIAPISSAISKVTQLNGVTYNWADPQKERRQQIGLIAQDVEKVFPQAVNSGPDGYKAVNYSGLIGPLVEAIKEQQAEIAVLQHQVAALQAAH